MMQAQKAGLGRGFAALIGDDAIEDASPEEFRGFRHIPIELVHANPNNPRKHFDEEELDELAASIREKGLLQPIVVRQRADGEYEIVAGERRWRASQRAGLHDLRLLIRVLSDGEALEIALIENIQRSDLNPLEEARAIGQLLEQFTYTQQQFADSLTKAAATSPTLCAFSRCPTSPRLYRRRQIDGGPCRGRWLRLICLRTLPTRLSVSAFQSVRRKLLREAIPTTAKRKAKSCKGRRYPLSGKTNIGIPWFAG